MNDLTTPTEGERAAGGPEAGLRALVDAVGAWVDGGAGSQCNLAPVSQDLLDAYRALGEDLSRWTPGRGWEIHEPAALSSTPAAPADCGQDRHDFGDYLNYKRCVTCGAVNEDPWPDPGVPETPHGARLGRWEYDEAVGWRLDDTDVIVDFDPWASPEGSSRGVWQLEPFNEELDRFLIGAMAEMERRHPPSAAPGERYEQDDRTCKAASTRPPDDAEWIHEGHTLLCPSCGRRVGMHGGFIARHFRPEALR